MMFVVLIEEHVEIEDIVFGRLNHTFDEAVIFW